jgi:hypothetical protein
MYDDYQIGEKYNGNYAIVVKWIETGLTDSISKSIRA